jgi:hypothetical protein
MSGINVTTSAPACEADAIDANIATQQPTTTTAIACSILTSLERAPLCSLAFIWGRSMICTSRRPQPGSNIISAAAPEVSAGTIIADLSAGTCTASTAFGTGTADCLVDTTTDPSNPYIIAQFECPVGTTALQNGCVGTGSQAWLVSTIQDGNIVQCYYRLPPTEANYAISVTATCAELEIVNAQGLAIKSTALLVKDFTAAKLKAKILG